MMDFIHIKNFKTLRDASFSLGYLNLFSGLNGMGKSTLIQSLLLLRQSYERNALKDKGLLLNGDCINIGNGKDALTINSSNEEITFTVRWESLAKAQQFAFGYNPDSDLLPLLQPSADFPFEQCSLFNRKFQYLSAERLGPQSQHAMSEFHIRDLQSLGHRGEYAVHFIATQGAQKLKIPALQHPKAIADTLLANIEAWMSEITPGLKIKADILPQFNTASLSYAFVQGKEVTEDFKPQNVGFGLSYVLPVVTSILRAQPGDLVIIENPESHLHPAGQAMMGKLCAIAAKNQVQLMIESHSDHFLNGVRVAVKHKIIDKNQVKIFFLQRDPHNFVHASEVLYPNIDDEGRLDCWPDGFFDQWDKSLDDLL